jgi:hypothetical protein
MTYVQRGAALLDKVRPGWFREIRKPIRPEDITACALGQVFGGYEEGCEMLGLGAWSSEGWGTGRHGLPEARKYGFFPPHSQEESNRRQWLVEIEKRMGAGDAA